MARGRRDAGREVFWREVVGRQAASGLGVRAFCRQEKLAESAFHWWRREIARRDAPKRPARLRPSTQLANRPAFLPVVVKGQQHGQQREEAITIELAGRRVLRLPGSIAAKRVGRGGAGTGSGLGGMAEASDDRRRFAKRAGLAGHDAGRHAQEF